MSNVIPEDLNGAVRAARRHLIPLLFLLGLICLLDRASVGYAALTMNADIGLSAAAYGLGAGIFFLGYVIFEIPSNIIMNKVGARIWIARIGVTWGIVTILMAFVWSEWSFYALRLLLGLAEAGLFPAVYLIFSRWFPARHRAQVLALFLTCGAISGIIGGPIASLIFTVTDGTALVGWRTLFVVLGIPAIILGIITFFVLPNKPADARWLTANQKVALQQTLAAEMNTSGVVAHTKVWAGLKSALSNPFIWGFTAIFFLYAMANYGVVLFLPQIIASFTGTSPAVTSLLSSIPWIAALFTSIFIATHSDRTGERRWHFVIPAVVGGLGLFAAGNLLGQPLPAMIALCIAVAGLGSLTPLIMARATAVVAGTAAAAGIAVVNAIGSIGGFVGPYVVGFIKGDNDSYFGGLAVLAGALILAAIITLAIRTVAEGRPNARFTAKNDAALARAEAERATVDI
jgi:ACS family tartrate transporter-like MFS transporter